MPHRTSAASDAKKLDTSPAAPTEAQSLHTHHQEKSRKCSKGSIRTTTAFSSFLRLWNFSDTLLFWAVAVRTNFPTFFTKMPHRTSSSKPTRVTKERSVGQISSCSTSKHDSNILFICSTLSLLRTRGVSIFSVSLSLEKLRFEKLTP